MSFYPFARINDAIADMRSGVTIKPVLLMPGQEADFPLKPTAAATP